MTKFLYDLAIAHRNHEGWWGGIKPSRSFRNNNPGNIRAADGEFIVFKSYEAGLIALEGDIRAKISNQSAAMNRYYAKNHFTYKTATFLDYIHVYAPTDDGNNPSGYCQSLCRQLAQYNLKPQTLLSDMAKLIYGELSVIPEPILLYLPVLPPEARIKGLLRRRENETNPGTIGLINFVLEQLYKRLKV